MIDANGSSHSEDYLFAFLKEWFSGLIKGIEALNDETWPKVLEMTGRACAKIHSSDLFLKIWGESKNLDEFLESMNQYIGEDIYRRIDSNTLKVSYSKCKCPLVNSGLVDSPLICGCSPNWLLENFEAILKTDLDITTEETILRGAENCRFTISF